jgi:nitroreductase
MSVNTLFNETRTLRDDEPAVPSRDTIDVIFRRRSIRAYTPDVLDERQVRMLLDGAVHAPAAMHDEPWRFVVVQDRAMLNQVSDLAKEIAVRTAAHHGNMLKPPGAAGDGVPSLLADPEFNIFYDASTLVAIGARPTNDFIAADCWLAAENVMLEACALGLGTCCIGFAVAALNDPDVKKKLEIPEDIRIYAPIIVGVPRGEVLPVPRRAPVVIRWIR